MTIGYSDAHTLILTIISNEHLQCTISMETQNKSGASNVLLLHYYVLYIVCFMIYNIPYTSTQNTITTNIKVIENTNLRKSI